MRALKILIDKFIWRYNDLIFNIRLFTIPYFFKYYFFLLIGKKNIKIKIRNVSSSFLIRVSNSIDRNLLDYVFVKKYHLPPKEVSFNNTLIIVDLGSNIGCTIVDYKSHYPHAHIWGYEMSPENFKLALENTKELSNVSINNKAVWINKGCVTFDLNTQTDAFSIDTKLGSNINVINVDCVSIRDIIIDNKLDHIDFLKMDIEGSEIEILNQSDISWLNQIRSFNIEFHNISELQLQNYISMFQDYGFITYKSSHHWLSILGYRCD